MRVGPHRRHRRPKCVLLFLVLALLSGCRGAPENSVTAAQRGETGDGALSSTAAKRDWGARLLSLVPSRDDPSLPSLSLARRAFSDCLTKGPQSTSMQCSLDRGQSSQAPGAGTITVQMHLQGGRVDRVFVTDCCSEEAMSFRPILTEQVLGSELLCPGFTFVASDSVHAYRVAAPGKRDFVYVRTERMTAEGSSVSLMLVLQPIDPGDECAALSDAQAP